MQASGKTGQADGRLPTVYRAAGLGYFSKLFESIPLEFGTSTAILVSSQKGYNSPDSTTTNDQWFHRILNRISEVEGDILTGKKANHW